MAVIPTQGFRVVLCTVCRAAHMPARAEGSCFALQVLSEQRQQLEQEQEQAEARMFSMCRKAVVTQRRL